MTYSSAKAHILKGRAFAQQWLNIGHVARQSFLREAKRYLGEGVPIRRRTRPLSSLTEEEALHVAKLVAEDNLQQWHKKKKIKWTAERHDSGCWTIKGRTGKTVYDNCVEVFIRIATFDIEITPDADCYESHGPSTIDAIKVADYLRSIRIHIPV